MVNILTEVQQARKSSKLLDSLKVRFESGTWRGRGEGGGTWVPGGGGGGGGGVVGVRVR